MQPIHFVTINVIQAFLDPYAKKCDLMDIVVRVQLAKNRCWGKKRKETEKGNFRQYTHFVLLSSIFPGLGALHHYVDNNTKSPEHFMGYKLLFIVSFHLTFKAESHIKVREIQL